MSVGVLFSEGSRQVFVARAVAEGRIYRFKGSRGDVEWMTGEAYLAVNGAASILRRLGASVDILAEETCSVASWARYRTIICPNACRLEPDTVRVLESWMRGGGKLVVSGETDLSGTAPAPLRFDWSLFEYAGSVLQGHRRASGAPDDHFHLDKLAWQVREQLRDWGCELDAESPWGDHQNVLVLRHDTDSSTDRTYLDYEVEHEVPATYAILRDRNRAMYLSAIAPHPFLEASFHYTSRRRLGLDRLLLVGKGIDRQVQKANQLGIPSATLHKHGHRFYYPETIEALDYVYGSSPEVVGMGTMARCQNLRYSGDRSMADSYTIQPPNVSVPFWFPFHLVMPRVAGHKVLRGWDCSHFMEPTPGLVNAIFRNASMLPYGVYMLGFHPAHARSDTFRLGGNFPWFRYAVEEAQKRGWLIANYRTVCEALS